MSEQNRGAIRRLFQLFNEDVPHQLAARDEDGVVGYALENPGQRLGALDEVLAPDARIHVPGAGAMSREDYKGFLASFYRAFPGLQVTIEDEITDRDKVIARWTIKGDHQGEFQGLPPTGKPVTLTGIAIWRMLDGKAVEEWVEWDALGLMQQLGAIPAPGQATVGAAR